MDGFHKRRLPNHSSVRSFQRHIFAWYRTHKRSFPWRASSSTRYEQIIAEVLLKRTRAETVARFFRPFVKQFPSWSRLSKASETELRGFLQPIGLWRQRAQSLKALAMAMSTRHGRFPRGRDAVELLPGVGQYVANAVLLFCHGDHEPLLDAGMARVLERCFGARTLVDIRYDPWLQNIARRIVDHERAAELNWAILDLAAIVCTASQPHCDECPVLRHCQYARTQH
jgi:A/G-specific adenine glycosylase